MECELEYHDETWAYTVSYQGLALYLTIHRDLDGEDGPVDRGLSENKRGVETPIYWTDNEFSTCEEAMADVQRWLEKNVKDGKLPPTEEVPQGTTLDAPEPVAEGTNAM